jgi:hypothetical protein
MRKFILGLRLINILEFYIVYGRGVYRVLVGKPDGERPLGRLGHSWEDNIKTGLQEVGWKAWTGLIWPNIGTGGWLF